MMYDAIRIGAVRPGALIARLQEMHVDAAAGARRCLRNPFEHFVSAPLHAGRSVLHGDALPFDLGGDCFHHADLFAGGNRRTQESAGDARAGRRRQVMQQLVMRTVNDRIAVAAMNGECDAQADIARCLGYSFGLGRKIGHPLHAGVVHHGGADAAADRTAERYRRAEPGID
jgi:hypothetical protein